MNLLSISEKILFFISGSGILQGVLLAAVIYFSPKSDRSVNKFLALYVFCFSCVLSMPFIMQYVGWQKTPFIEPIPLLVGPALYLYLSSFKGGMNFKKIFPHLLFPFVFLIIMYFLIGPFAKKYPNAHELPVGLIRDPAVMLMSFLKVCQYVFYYFLSRRALLAYQKSIQHLFSETSKVDLAWAKFLVNGYMVILIATIGLFIAMKMLPGYFMLLLLLNVVIIIPYIYLATYKGFMQPAIWQVKEAVSKEMLEINMMEATSIEIAIVNTEDQKNSKTGLSKSKLEVIAEAITYLMEKEKLYQETQLTLQELADKLKLPAYQVSQVINEGMNKNFYDLVNTYRVAEAKRLLLDPKSRNYTILSVGFEAGFNSKTTFNTVFKKFTGFTPTDFRHTQNRPVEIDFCPTQNQIALA